MSSRPQPSPLHLISSPPIFILLPYTKVISYHSPLTMSCTAWPGLQPCLESFGSRLDIKQSLYVHPVYRHSLSARSLELCTENLGCETGTLDFLSSSFGDYDDHQRERQPVKSTCRTRSSTSVSRPARDFPPPLTTISGQHHFRVRARREGGRLMLQAVNVHASGTFLYAERSGGRLTLRFRGETCIKYYQNEEHDNEQEQEEECKEKEREEVGEDKSSCPSGLSKQVEEDDDDDGEEFKQVVKDRREQKVQEKKDEACLSSDMDLNKFEDNIGGNERGILTEKFRRPGRCIENGHGNKGLPFWEPYWVVSS